MRLTWRTVAGAGLAGLLLVLGLGSLLPRRWRLPVANACPIPVYLWGGAIHTDLILPKQNQYVDWSELLPLEQIGATNAPYLSFGFGEQRFYMGEPGSLLVRWPQGLRALLGVNASIIFVNPLPAVPPSSHCVGLTAAQYQALVAHIQASFQRNQQGAVVPLGRGHQPTGQFFQAQPAYSLLFTCNHWTAQGLDRAGVPTPRFPLLSQSILWHARRGCRCL